MILVATATTAASLAALAWIAAGDAKRRTAFRLPPAPRRRPGLGWTAVFLPGVAAAWLGGGAAFLVWFGAVTVAGWAVAALRPATAERGRLAAASAAAAVAERVAAVAERTAAVARGVRAGAARLAAAARAPRPAEPDRVALLEARVAALEAELATLRGAAAPAGPSDGIVVELTRPARR